MEASVIIDQASFSREAKHVDAAFLELRKEKILNIL
jgi:hypothetical protein